LKKKSSSKPVTKQQVRQMLKSKVENLVKYVDTTAFYSPSILNNPIAWTMPTTGTGASNMAGTSINIKELLLRMFMTFPNSSGTMYGYTCRFIIVQAISDDTVSIGDVLENSSTSQNAIVSPYSYELHNRMFRVLHDRTFYLSPSVTTYHESVSIKPKVPMARYNATGSYWGNGQIYSWICVWGNGISSSLPAFSLDSRTIFEDV
jgi:hypothetical protein